MNHLIEEPLPEHPLSSEVVLHVRRHLRARIRQHSDDASNALAMLFGYPWEAGNSEGWKRAAATAKPISAGADFVGESSGRSVGIVSLGHDDAHVEECHAWLRRRVAAEPTFEPIVADDLGTLLALSSAMDSTVAQHRGEQRGFLPILIQGETGTGKEVLARAIHDYWRKLGHGNGDLHVVQVAGISRDLIYAELFGAVKGAYTGAQKNRVGRLEQADGGTLMIDEVGDLPPEAQVALLRFLQDQKIRKLGEEDEHQVNVRIIAATWRDLDIAVREGNFRLDLLHRIRGSGSIRLPSLRDRAPFDGVVDRLLVLRGHEPRMTRGARDAIRLYTWPGNLRELVTAVDAVLSVAQPDETLRLEHLPRDIQRDYLSRPLEERAPGLLCDAVDDGDLPDGLIGMRIESISRRASVAAGADVELAARREFLANIKGDAEGNALAIHHLGQAIAFDCEGRRHTELASFWRRILRQSTMPAEIESQILGFIDGMNEKARQASAAANGEMAMGSIRENVWLRMLDDLQQSPLFAGSNAAAVASVLWAVREGLMAFAPDFARQAVDAYREDAFPGVIRLIEEAIDEGGSALDVEKNDVDDYRDWPRERWEELAKEPRLKDAAARAEIDPKTVNKYMKIFAIVPPWDRKRARKSEGK